MSRFLNKSIFTVYDVMKVLFMFCYKMFLDTKTVRRAFSKILRIYCHLWRAKIEIPPQLWLPYHILSVDIHKKFRKCYKPRILLNLWCSTGRVLKCQRGLFNYQHSKPALPPKWSYQTFGNSSIYINIINFIGGQEDGWLQLPQHARVSLSI